MSCALPNRKAHQVRTLFCLLLFLASCPHAVAQQSDLLLQNDEEADKLTVLLGDREFLTYQYAPEFALPHIWPLRSPSGKPLTEQKPDPYPHHRSLWIADRVRIGQHLDVDFYHCFKNYHQEGKPESGYKHFIRHKEFAALHSEANSATFTAKLQWIVNDSTPVIEETRTHRAVALDDGEYLLDMQWELRPASGRTDLVVVSDWVHYAWPYLRVHPQFSGENGGTITADNGNRGQSQTNNQYAKWVDYSNTVEGKTEGVAVFPFEQQTPFKWLTREYGTFGPRRPDQLSGKHFALKPDDPLKGHAAIFVHQGNAQTGRVAERYQQYVDGKL